MTKLRQFDFKEYLRALLKTIPRIATVYLIPLYRGKSKLPAVKYAAKILTVDLFSSVFDLMFRIKKFDKKVGRGLSIAEGT